MIGGVIIMNYTVFVSVRTVFSGQKVRHLLNRARTDHVAAPMDEIRATTGENDAI